MRAASGAASGVRPRAAARRRRDRGQTSSDARVNPPRQALVHCTDEGAGTAAGDADPTPRSRRRGCGSSILPEPHARPAAAREHRRGPRLRAGRRPPGAPARPADHRRLSRRGVALGPFTPGFQGDRRHPPDGRIRRDPADVRRRPALLVGDLWQVRRVAIPGAVIQMAIVAARRLRPRRAAWGISAGAAPGSSASPISVASTVVLMRALMDHGWLDTPHGQGRDRLARGRGPADGRDPRAAAGAGRRRRRRALDHGRASRSARRCSSSR